MNEHVVLRLPRDLAVFLERTIWDVWEHMSGGRPLLPGPPELERELVVAMWDLREALGASHLYDAQRPPSRSSGRYAWLEGEEEMP